MVQDLGFSYPGVKTLNLGIWAFKAERLSSRVEETASRFSGFRV